MVDIFPFEEGASKAGLHDCSVLKERLAVDYFSHVTVTI